MWYSLQFTDAEICKLIKGPQICAYSNMLLSNLQENTYNSFMTCVLLETFPLYQDQYILIGVIIYPPYKHLLHNRLFYNMTLIPHSDVKLHNSATVKAKERGLKCLELSLLGRLSYYFSSSVITLQTILLIYFLKKT